MSAIKKLVEERKAVAEKARGILATAEQAGEGFTPEQIEELKSFTAEIKAYDEQIKSSMDAQSLLDSIDQMPEVEKKEADGSEIRIGQHFIKSAFGELNRLKGTRGMNLVLPEFKAATDTHLTTTTGQGIILPEYDLNIVKGKRQRPFLAEWLGTGTLTGNTLVYFTESPLVEGAAGTVAEGSKKPQLHFPDYDPVTETLKKVAGYIKISDEMTEDAAFLVSEIEGRLLYQLQLAEEDQLLNGTGTGTNVLGLLNRSGIQTETAAGEADVFDAIFRAMTKVETATDLVADGVAINPIDYQKLRLTKDGNGQYIAGGPFQGQYGNGDQLDNPPIWGKRTIVTPAIAQGTVLVGAGQLAATVYRKGGLTLQATNTNEDDFVNNKITILGEERLALAVRRPSAFVKVTIGEEG
ncbi:phage major capsid protein [Leucobacter muris]|uniref:Phage major capsid protein n=1 Tax=Leucobacter muris TaxID=1935379 RepID=A0ABX5QID4_9MICO|nr:phage major capsid protein [Leucobacter muris]QAB18785.1 phage major capsid protein [Leucobacter muris]